MTTSTTSDRVLTTIAEVATDRWAFLADIRAAHPEIDRAEMDATLKALARSRAVVLSPMHAGYDRRDARLVAGELRMGGEAKGLVAVQR